MLRETKKGRKKSDDARRVLIVVIFAISVGALTFKISNFVHFPRIWVQHKELKLAEQAY